MWSLSCSYCFVCSSITKKVTLPFYIPTCHPELRVLPQCCQLGHFNTIVVFMIVKRFGCTTIHKKRYINAAFIHSCPRVEATTITWYLSSGMRGEPRQNPRVFYRESDFYREPPSNRDWASFKSKLGGVKGLFWKPGNPVLPKTFLFLETCRTFFFC